jgi:chromosome segregation ATPase
MQLDESKDAYRQLEQSISREDLKFKQKAQNLEKNLDQIHQMYQNVTSEKSILKVDLQVAERKLERKNAKIETLEKTVLQSRQKQQDYLTIIKQLKQEFLKVQSSQVQI